MPNTKLSTPVAATAQNNPGVEPRLISAVSADGAAPQFKIPFSSQAIQSVESVDLDLVLTTATGEKIILQQGALQAATQPDSKIVFQNGDSITAADQIKKLGILKPVEGGSFRLKSGDASPAVAEKVTGDAFGLGKELQDTMSQLTETSKQLEKVLQTLTTASLSTTTDDAKPITAGPGTGTGVQKITPQSDKFASPSPGSPPKLEVEEFTSNNTSNNLDNNSSPAKVSFSLLAANKEGVNYQDNALGKTEVRQFLGKSNVELTMSDTAQSLEFTAGKVENQLLLADVPTTNSLILNINDQQPGFKIPDGLTINGQAITAGTPLTIDVTGMTNNEVPLNLGWQEGSAAVNSDFQLTVAYVGPNGETNLKTITFTGKAENAYTLDANGEPRQFIASQADNLIVTANDAYNTIITGNGNDTIKGSGGADTINGGAGKDTVDYSASTAAVTVNVTSGAGTGGQAQGDQLSNIETLIGSSTRDTLDFSGASTAVTADLILGTSNQKLNGSSQDLSFSSFENVVGSANDDRFVASSVANDFKGGAGSDTVDYSNSAAVVVNLHTGKGFDNHAAGDKYSSIENLIGGAGDDTFFASEAANSFTGNGGLNRVNYEHSTAGVTINLSTGQGSGGFATGDRYATIQNATGSNHNDTFVANDKGNHFDGGNGTDTVSYENATGNVTVNLLNNTGSGSDAQGDRYSSIENATGGAGNDTFISGAGVNHFDGRGGINTLSYQGSTSGVTVNLDTRAASGGHAAGDTFTNIQNLTGGSGNDVLTGNANNNVLMGGDGADQFFGGAGTDTVSYQDSPTSVTIDVDNTTLGGGRGTGFAKGDVIANDVEHILGSNNNDTFYSSRTDLILDGGNGIDTVITSINDYTLGANLENLTLTGTATKGTGNDLDNVITGNGNNNHLIGGGGNDILVINASGLSSGTFDGGSGTDTLKIMASAGATIDLHGIDNTKFISIETLDLTAQNNNILKLDLNTIKSLVDNTSGTPTLSVKLGTGDTIEFVADTGQQVFNNTTAKTMSIFASTSSSLEQLAIINYA
jgi:Ca2+-binding RTX toxin-like protein